MDWAVQFAISMAAGAVLAMVRTVMERTCFKKARVHTPKNSVDDS